MKAEDLTEIFTRAIQQSFQVMADVTLESEKPEPVGKTWDYCASMGIAKGTRGSIALCMDLADAQALAEKVVEGAGENEALIMDALKEFANLVAGSAVRDLQGTPYAYPMAVPNCGKGVLPSHPPGTEPHRMGFRFSAGKMLLEVSCLPVAAHEILRAARVQDSRGIHYTVFFSLMKKFFDHSAAQPPDTGLLADFSYAMDVLMPPDLSPEGRYRALGAMLVEVKDRFLPLLVGGKFAGANTRRKLHDGIRDILDTTGYLRDQLAPERQFDKKELAAVTEVLQTHVESLRRTVRRVQG